MHLPLLTSSRAAVELQPSPRVHAEAQLLAQLPPVVPVQTTPRQAADVPSLQLNLQPQHARPQGMPKPSAMLAGVLQSGSSEDFANACLGLTQRVSTCRARAPVQAQEQMTAGAAAQTGEGNDGDDMRPCKRARLDERPESEPPALAQQEDRGQEAPAQATCQDVRPKVHSTGGGHVLHSSAGGQLQQEHSPRLPDEAGALLLTPVGLAGFKNLLDAQCISTLDDPMRLSAILRCCSQSIMAAVPPAEPLLAYQHP